MIFSGLTFRLMNGSPNCSCCCCFRWLKMGHRGTRRRRKAPQECGANAHIYDHLAFASRPRRLGFSSAHWAALNVNAAWLKCCGEISAIRLESASHENCTFGLPHHLQIVHIFTKLYSNIFLGLDQLITTISLYKMHIHMYKIEENLKSHKNINTWKMFRNRILSAQAPNQTPDQRLKFYLIWQIALAKIISLDPFTSVLRCFKARLIAIKFVFFQLPFCSDFPAFPSNC